MVGMVIVLGVTPTFFLMDGYKKCIPFEPVEGQAHRQPTATLLDGVSDKNSNDVKIL